MTLEGSDVSKTVWAKVLDKLTAGRMPPSGSPQPAKSEVRIVTAWIEQLLGQSPGGDPGRVTARRLNRAEYNNTIRDLLGVSLRPADEFPLDDAGYGFDNIGDVLSVSPLLMEKYMDAARKLSQAAVFGESAPAKPTKLIRYLTKKSQDDPTPRTLPYSYRGAAYGSFRFPVTAEYEFRMRVGNYRPRDTGTPRQKELSRRVRRTEAEQRELDELNRLAFPPVRMVMTLDGKQILTEVVEGNIDYKYAHGESIARVKVSAGEHLFRASFPEFAGMADPRDNVNLDGRRKLFIDYIDIVGPFNPVAEPSSIRARIFVCPEKTAGCGRRIIANLARRAWRRPATSDEVDRLAHLAESVQRDGDSFEEGIRTALQAILVSPAFLFRIEHDRPGAGGYPLGDHELASRLSYFLWSSMPDETLSRAAEEGNLRKPAAIEAQVRRMLADPRAEALVENFAGQWLGVRLLDRRKPDPAKFPRVDDELVESMHRETMLFAGALLRENRSVLEFLDSRFTFVNGPLANLYGIASVKGEGFQRVEVNGEKRGGVLTQGSVLTLSSYATRTSPVLRGKWVLENMLGTPPPPPPADVPALSEEHLGTAASLRERLEQHRAKPSCAVCHDLMDGIGFGLENYDASGAWRDREGGFAIDASGQLPGGVTFRGSRELKQVLRSRSIEFTRNLTEKMMTYALGRGLETYDRPTVERIVELVSSDGHRFQTLILEIVKSRPFQMRRGEGGKLASR